MILEFLVQSTLFFILFFIFFNSCATKKRKKEKGFCCYLNLREIHEAVQNLVRPNQLFADAVDARQVISLSSKADLNTHHYVLL